MKIVSWNMNIWENIHIYNLKKDKKKLLFFKNNHEEVNLWIQNCKNYIHELNADIFLLQETNPFALYKEKYEKNDINQYKLEKENNIIYYHELYNELYNEKLREDFWGNAIYIKKNNFTQIENNLFTKEKIYYGQNGLMCYNFKLKNGKELTIINYYNKRNLERKCYTMPNDIKNDLEILIKNKKDSLIILAGDFNSDKERDKSSKAFFNFIEDKGFENITNGVEFYNTMVPKARSYPNDKIFLINKNKVVRLNCKLINDRNEDLSDHYPISVEFDIS